MHALLLAHGTAGLAGDGVPVAVVYALVVGGALLGAAALRARGAVAVGGEAVPPLSVDGAESGAWPGDGAPAPVRLVLHGLGVAALAYVLVAGWAGAEQVGANPVTLVALSVAWWTVPALSWLLGDWWRLVDPFDALAAGLDRLRRRPSPPTADDEEAGDWWVPALLLASFAWLTTCLPGGRGFRPQWIAAWVTALTVVMVVGHLVAGRAWVRRSSPLAVLCGTVAAASPVAWRAGRPSVRSPLRGLAARAGGRRSLAVVVVMVAAALWEATSSTGWWGDVVGLGDDAITALWSTIGLAWMVLLVGGAWALAARAAGWLVARQGGPEPDEPLAADLAVALGPLAVAAGLVHQLGNLLDDWRTLPALLLDPLSEGWDPIGAYSWTTAGEVLAPGTLGWVQVAVLALALGTGLVAGWDRLVARAGGAALTAGWALGAWSAVAGVVALWLLLGA